MSESRRPKVLLGSTGSVASIKVAALCRLLLEFADVKLIVTSSAKHFINEDDLPDAVKPVLGDEAEWRQWRAVGDPVLHIELRRWADVLLLAPLSANTLAKLAAGMADNLLSCVVRAWDFAKPMLLAPAMNTAMWASPFTSRHLNTLVQLGGAAAAAAGADGGGGGSGGSTVVLIPPVSKRLACGDEGTGAMASPEDIAAACRQAAAYLPPAGAAAAAVAATAAAAAAAGVVQKAAAADAVAAGEAAEGAATEAAAARPSEPS